MNKYLFIPLCIIALSCCFVLCTDDDDDTGDTGKTVVGTWEEIINATPPFIPYDLLIQIIIKDTDSTFFLSVIEQDAINNDTLYKHTGTWEIGNSRADSLILYGEECFILDTTANPDTLMPLPDTVCQDIIKLDTNGTTSDNDEWVIKMASLAPFMEAFLPPQIIQLIANMDLYMERKDLFTLY